MNRSRSWMIALFIILTASLLSFAVNAEQAGEKGATPPPKATIFAVYGATGQLSAQMEPILILDKGKFTQPVAGDSDAAEIKRFSAANYRKGQKYQLLFGGAEAGTATVKKSDVDEECFRTGADVTLQTDAKLNRNVMALATDTKQLGLAAGQRSRRAPTDNERAAALDLARAAFKQKGVAASLLSTMEVINLTAIDLDRDGKAELAGSFVASKKTAKQERYALFLLALPQGTSYRAAVSNFNKVTEQDIMSGASINAVNEGIYVERLVDHLDLDGDRVSELITLTTGLEGVSYEIYQSKKGAWSKVYEFGNYRCAF